jgi:hypothetical protein
MDRGRVRAKLSQALKRVHGFTGYFQLYNMPFNYLHLFNYKEQRNIFERGGINGGQATIFDYLRDHAIPFCRPETYDEAASIDEVRRAINSQAIQFAYLFLGRLDAILHERGTRSPAVLSHLAWYENQLRRLYELAAERYKDVSLFVFSDHGMADVCGTCDLMGRIARLGLTYGTDYVAVYDSTMARFWFLREGVRETIFRELEREPLGHIMSDEKLAAYGCDFPGNVYGELFFLMDPGFLICPSNMGIKPLAGMHGYAPEHKDSIATFMSSTPLTPPPAGLTDLYNVMQNSLSTSATLY